MSSFQRFWLWFWYSYYILRIWILRYSTVRIAIHSTHLGLALLKLLLFLFTPLALLPLGLLYTFHSYIDLPSPVAPSTLRKETCIRKFSVLPSSFVVSFFIAIHSSPNLKLKRARHYQNLIAHLSSVLPQTLKSRAYERILIWHYAGRAYSYMTLRRESIFLYDTTPGERTSVFLVVFSSHLKMPKLFPSALPLPIDRWKEWW